MSVFTPLEHHELEAFVAPYGLGRLQAFEGIAGGSENSNFFVSLERAECVLTLVERGPADDLPFFIELLDVLHTAGLPVPYALRSEDGEALRRLAEKPALLQPRLRGAHVYAPNPHHCAEVGRLLAGLHLATATRLLERPSDRGIDWMLREGPLAAVNLPEAELPLLREALAEAAMLAERLGELPQANLHADLFRDNVLFDGAHLSGIIDFYNACSGPMLYDLAIAVNDWCSEPNGELDAPRAQALLAAYCAARHFTPAEAELWPAMLRLACLRFWLSRLIAQQAHAGLGGVLIKNPEEFRRRLQARRTVPVGLPLAL